MKIKRLARCLLLAAVFSLLLGLAAYAAPVWSLRYTNPKTGYQVLILDDANLLSAAEEASLVEVMTPITEYGHIIFWSTNESAVNEINQARDKRFELCGNESSGILSINMSRRKLTFQSDGEIYRWVSGSYARSITDNASHYASEGDYAQCGIDVFRQVLQVLRGNRIAEPMRWISVAVLGLMLAFVLVVGLAFSRRRNPLTKGENQACRIQTGELLVGRPHTKYVSTRNRLWVRILLGILSGIGRALIEGIFHGGGSSSGGSRSSGGGSRGGGGGGSSSF